MIRRHSLAHFPVSFTEINRTMENSLNACRKPLLLDLIAGNLLEKGFSISFQKLQNIEFLSASCNYSGRGDGIFLAFDPSEINAITFLKVLCLLKSLNEKNILIVVSEEGVREILNTIIKIQEIEEVEILNFEELCFYPLQLVR